ncbi:hypothetical protein BLSTO_05257 [Blastocystis sp. subtype 1]
MTDLPSLHHISGKGGLQFLSCSVVKLKNICDSVDNDLPNSFGNVHTLIAENASTMEQFIRSTSYHFSHASYSDSLSPSLVEIACDAQLANCNSITSINLSQFPNLQSFTCPSFSFPNVSSFKCENHCSIQSIQIGKSSLCGKEGEFIISNCPALNEVVIGSRSCVMYTSFRLEKCDQLKTLLFGREKELSGCFGGCHTLRVENLPCLERVELGTECFNECSKVSFSNLPHLTSLLFGLFACCGESFGYIFKDDLDEMNRNSEFVMEDLPALQVWIMNRCFLRMSRIIVDNVNVDVQRSTVDFSFDKSTVFVKNSPDVKRLFDKYYIRVYVFDN